MTGRKLAPAVGRLARSLELSLQGELLAAQARHLADLIDRGDVPAYAVAAAHRELRAIVEALAASAHGAEGGITDAEIEELLRGAA